MIDTRDKLLNQFQLKGSDDTTRGSLRFELKYTRYPTIIFHG